MKLLVLLDFDWTIERAFTDEKSYQFYNQLSYKVNFVSVFDCYHSGGMTCAAVNKVGGLAPLDDIHHRILKWDARHEMWDECKFKSPNSKFKENLNSINSPFKSTHRLGQAGFESFTAYRNEKTSQIKRSSRTLFARLKSRFSSHLTHH